MTSTADAGGNNNMIEKLPLKKDSNGEIPVCCMSKVNTYWSAKYSIKRSTLCPGQYTVHEVPDGNPAVENCTQLTDWHVKIITKCARDRYDCWNQKEEPYKGGVIFYGEGAVIFVRMCTPWLQICKSSYHSYVCFPNFTDHSVQHKGSGTLYIQKCPWKKHIWGMWIYCPDS